MSPNIIFISLNACAYRNLDSYFSPLATEVVKMAIFCEASGKNVLKLIFPCMYYDDLISETERSSLLPSMSPVTSRAVPQTTFPFIWRSSEQGAVSIRKTVLPGMAIPMLKIRRPNRRLIFNMEIAIRR